MAAPPALTAYLSQAYLSPLLLSDAAPEVQQFAEPWPRMPELNCNHSYTRHVREVNAIPLMVVENAVRNYFLTIGSHIKMDWEDMSFTMPCAGLVVLGRRALHRLVIDGDNDYLQAVEHFVLETAAGAVRTLENRPFDHAELKYVRYPIGPDTNGQTVCTLYMFGKMTAANRGALLQPGIVIISLPPWKFGASDVAEFALRQSFGPGELDKERRDGNGSQWSNATKLWAMLYDTCKLSGYRWFVITTYTQWVFGTWSLDWSGVDLTPPIPFDKTQKVTLLELFIFWTQCSRGKDRFWQLAPNVQ